MLQFDTHVDTLQFYVANGQAEDHTVFVSNRVGFDLEDLKRDIDFFAVLIWKRVVIVNFSFQGPN